MRFDYITANYDRGIPKPHLPSASPEDVALWIMRSNGHGDGGANVEAIMDEALFNAPDRASRAIEIGEAMDFIVSIAERRDEAAKALLNKSHEKLAVHKATVQSLLALKGRETVMDRLTMSKAHDFIERGFMFPTDEDCSEVEWVPTGGRIATRLPVILVTRNWDALLSPMEGYDTSSDVMLPFPNFLLEFQIAGASRTIVLVESETGFLSEARFGVVAEVPKDDIEGYAGRFKGGWPWVNLNLSVNLAEGVRGREVHSVQYLINFAVAQLRAVSIATEAEVATKAYVPAPDRLNRSRARSGKVALRDYYTLDITKRSESSHAGDASYQGVVRFHLRRGHWYSHPSAGRIWRKWTFVGNIALGVVHKDYRA